MLACRLLQAAVKLKMHGHHIQLQIAGGACAQVQHPVARQSIQQTPCVCVDTMAVREHIAMESCLTEAHLFTDRARDVYKVLGELSLVDGVV
jgi:hypothetical protein